MKRHALHISQEHKKKNKQTNRQTGLETNRGGGALAATHASVYTIKMQGYADRPRQVRLAMEKKGSKTPPLELRVGAWGWERPYAIVMLGEEEEYFGVV